MGIINDIWSKTKFAREAEEKRKQKELEEEVRAEIQSEIKEEAKKLLKEKIKQQEIDRIVNPETKPKSNFLAKLGEEFKGSNLGSNDQMGKLMGKPNNNTHNAQVNTQNLGLSNEGIVKAFGSTNPQKTTKNNGVDMLGTRNYNFERNNKDSFGVQKQREEQVVGMPDTKKQLNRMLGK